MIPQMRERKMSETPDWRAEPVRKFGPAFWRVVSDDQTICSGVEEWQAKLIAAAPAKAALCEELADALEYQTSVLKAHNECRPHSLGMEQAVEQATNALKAAGRTPG